MIGDLFRVDGRAAVVTGAGRGLGAAAAVALAEAAVSAFGRLDIVVNNVGGAMPRPFLDTAPRHLSRAFEFNVATAHSLTRAAVPHLLAAAQDGATSAVINITSTVGRVAGRGYLAYGTAKAALAHYTRLAAADLAPRIRVNGIAVGAAATSALDIVVSDDGLRQQLEQSTPLARIGDPREVAAAVVYLAAPSGGYLTGKILEVDGGIQVPNLDLGLEDL
jgi:7-alpha-hydroxysteroid dehydrogenase